MLAPGSLGFLAPERCGDARRCLHDPELQERLDDVGYVVVPLLSSEQVAELTDGFDAIAADLGGTSAPEDYNSTYAEFTIIHSQPDFRRRAFELICSTLQPAIERYLIDYRPLVANFVNKPPGTGVVPAHQNFSVVDEAVERSVSVWVALVDCTMANGAMAMLDGSHRNLRGRRGMWAYQAFTGIEQEALDPLLTPVEVPAGHAVILDDALVHYSPPNLTQERRLAIQFVMVPAETPAYWFQQVGEDEAAIEVAVWEIEPQFFFDFWHGDGDERFAKPAGTMRVPNPVLELDGLLDLVAGGEAADPPAQRSDPPRRRGVRGLISKLLG